MGTPGAPGRPEVCSAVVGTRKTFHDLRWSGLRRHLGAQGRDPLSPGGTQHPVGRMSMESSQGPTQSPGFGFGVRDSGAGSGVK